MSTSSMKFPVLSNEGGLSAYLDQIKKFPMLDAEEEYMLAKNWKILLNKYLYEFNVYEVPRTI